MVPTPIPAHLIHTVFQYILPPSLPLPPHLLSGPLIERHHFLSISSADTTSYLCWPSPDTAQVAAALERGIQDTLMSEPIEDVRYTAPDAETVLAHIRPDSQSPLQIVFAWDAATETWRYHDSRMLPFPQASLPSLDATLANSTSKYEPDHLSYRPRSASPLSDNYWGGYDSSSSSPVPTNVPTVEDDKAEAAYWASYAMVQGSGDSTMPSPKLDRGRSVINQTLLDTRDPEPPFDPLVTHLHLRLSQDHDFLNSPRPPHLIDDEEMFVNRTDGLVNLAPTQSSEQIRDKVSGFPTNGELELADPKASKPIVVKEMSSTETVNDLRTDSGDDGLREAIRGIYRMWKAQSGTDDANTFLDIVKGALEI